LVKLTSNPVHDDLYDLVAKCDVLQEKAEMSVTDVHSHIKLILDQVGDLKKLRFLNKQEELRVFLNGIGFDLKNMDQIFALDVNTSEISYFYWIYKRNYLPWREKYNFMLYMKLFPDIFSGDHPRPILGKLEDVKISLGIVFYYDKLLHN
jgi:hypothetical protein